MNSINVSKPTNTKEIMIWIVYISIFSTKARSTIHYSNEYSI